MSRIYKFHVLDNLSDRASEVFRVELNSEESFDSFKDEIFDRMPELKNQPLKIYYKDADGDEVTIFNASDFGIFQKQNTNKVFVLKNGEPKNYVQVQGNSTFVSAPQRMTYQHFFARIIGFFRTQPHEKMY